MILIGMLILLEVVLLGVALLDYAIEEVLPIGCFTIIIMMYVLSAIGIMGYTLLIIMEIVLFIIFLFAVYKKKFSNNIFSKIFTPGFFIFLMLSVMLYWFTSEVKVFQWDEFTHWATTVKDMYYTSRLSIYSDSVTSFTTYPPAMALWEYLFVAFGRDYSDAGVIFAYDIYCVIMMIPVAKYIGKNLKFRIVSIPLLLVIIFAVPYLFYTPWEGSAWRCVYIDRALSLTMTYMFFVYFDYKGDTRKNEIKTVISLALAAAILPLLKSTGNFLVLCVVVVIFIDNIILNRANIKGLHRKNIIAIVLSWILARESWNLFLKMKTVPVRWDVSNVSIKNLILLITGKEDPWRYEVIQKFVNALKEDYTFTNGILDISYLSIIFVWAILGGCIYLLSTNKDITKKRIVPIGLVILAGYITYETSLLLMYLYVFSPEEGLALSGMSRYSSNYHLGITAFLLFLIWKLLINNKESIVGALFITVFLLNIVSVSQIKNDIFHHYDAIEKGYETTSFSRYQEFEDKYQYLMEKGKKVLIVSDNSMANYIFSKVCIPARSTWISLQEFISQNGNLENYIQNATGYYDYIYVDVSNTSEVDLSLLGEKDKSISTVQRFYKINANGHNKLQLIIN